MQQERFLRVLLLSVQQTGNNELWLGVGANYGIVASQKEET